MTKVKLAEKILLLLTKRPDNCIEKTKNEEWNLSNALSLLNKNFPNFSKSIINKKIVDFGCDCGYQSLALAKAGADFVLGLEINAAALNKARSMLSKLCLSKNVEFKDKVDDSLMSKFDIVIFTK